MNAYNKKIDSKTCPQCKETNNPQFKICWKCHYSFETGEAVIVSSAPAKKKMPKWPAIIAVILAVAITNAKSIVKVYSVTSPQHVTIGLRQLIPVARNKASLRLMPDVDKGGGSDADETVDDSPMVDVKCGRNGKETHRLQLTQTFSEEVCGIKVRVLKVYKGGLSGEYPYSDVEVIW